MKRFNTTGKCIASRHYMVRIDSQVEAAVRLVQNGMYFCINRGRQYGKTTTLSFLKQHLEKLGYAVFSISFEGLADSAFNSLEDLLYASIDKMSLLLELKVLPNLSASSTQLLLDASQRQEDSIKVKDYTRLITKMSVTDRMVLLIDEVDAASNYPQFIKFLGVLRDMYLSRDEIPTFQSVVLAGVYDIKNLKLKLRPEDEHQYNSPWNIAAQFDADMSLHTDGIAEMLEEYKNDHQLDFDALSVAQLIYDYTSGYPFLVSRLCQIIDEQGYTWDKEGVLRAVNNILKEKNTLFDDMTKQLSQFPGLSKILQAILYSGQRIVYNYYDKDINLASMFSIVYDKDGATAIRCRIFETWLYNYFNTFEKDSVIYINGEADRNQFIHNGHLDMRSLLTKFTEHFNEIYRPGKDDRFIEDNGRKIFLTYLRPIINGIGNYYCEATTRDLTRTDVIIDYLGQQYIVELKIWRGDSYNQRGEQQLMNYLLYYGLNTGYMVSFCFNKNKQAGVHDIIIGDKTICEAIV